MLTWNLHENDPECPRDAVSPQMKKELEFVINNVPQELNPRELSTQATHAQLLAVANYCVYKSKTFILCRNFINNFRF